MTKAYTLATYKVIPGKEDEFIEAWDRLAATFAQLPEPPYWGVLLRSRANPALFHSFGPWETAEHIAAMRNNPAAGAAFRAIGALCDKMSPGAYEIVRHVQVRNEPVP
jgi:quinol monooxygenase YgiN